MMKLHTLVLISGCLAAGIGCGDYAGGKQISAAGTENSESPNFGSATDISTKDGQRNTNAVNSADNGVGGPMQRASGNYQSQPLPGQASDQELAKKIKVALTTGSTGTTGVIAEDRLTKIDVQVQHGVVTLRGPVSSEEERRTIEKQVSGMKGVSGVHNELTLGSQTGQRSPTDAFVPRIPGNQ